MTLWLHALGHFHPENEITNRFLEELDIGTSDAWILERVGIRSRRTCLPLDYLRGTRNRDLRAAGEATLYTTADLGARAGALAIARAGIEPAQVRRKRPGLRIEAAAGGPADALRLSGRSRGSRRAWSGP